MPVDIAGASRFCGSNIRQRKYASAYGPHFHRVEGGSTLAASAQPDDHLRGRRRQEEGERRWPALRRGGAVVAVAIGIRIEQLMGSVVGRDVDALATLEVGVI